MDKVLFTGVAVGKGSGALEFVSIEANRLPLNKRTLIQNRENVRNNLFVKKTLKLSLETKSGQLKLPCLYSN